MQSKGGLGIRAARLSNEACLMNQACRIWTNPNHLGSSFFKHRYFLTENFLQAKRIQNVSHSRRAIMKGKNQISCQKGFSVLTLADIFKPLGLIVHAYPTIHAHILKLQASSMVWRDRKSVV